MSQKLFLSTVLRKLKFLIMWLYKASNAVSKRNEFPLRKTITASRAAKPNTKADVNGR